MIGISYQKVGSSGNSSVLQCKVLIVEDDEMIGLHVETGFGCSSFSIHEHVVLSRRLDFLVSKELLFGRHAFSFGLVDENIISKKAKSGNSYWKKYCQFPRKGTG